MSMDFRKDTYKPKRQDTRFRTSYSQMSQWMTQPEMNKLRSINRSVGNVFGKKVPKKASPINVEGAPSPYVDAATGAAIDDTVPPHLRFHQNAGHDDFHKAFLAVSKQIPSLSYPEFGPPRLRMGRAGGSWRHVKEVLQAGGHRIVFVDGQIRWEDTLKLNKVPGGNLIQPVDNSRTTPMVSPQCDSALGRKSRRERASNNLVRTSMYSPATKQALEKANWNIMR
ncbi:hypothetical protein KUTeg_016608 [Tegillarca granosa]|uniref:Uncharacterized protein n=1 Tax=Tegillarca granosa TaxID=220873 RepID=A0ABQ9ELD1_TEGGR|nr:hypothetical protein KUTeg_016608 [Tegillarca granosa]